MSFLLELQDIHKRYGPAVIFDGANALFSRGDKVGVIGRNGAGKTTLCRLILGLEEPDGGTIRKSARLRLGRVEQESPFAPGEAVLAYLERASQKERWQCGKVAGRFQLKGELLHTPIESLPGGYQTRVKLAAMLLDEPNFLVLDEPTNYLDLRTLLLLERFLAGFSGGFLIVSHDREFLKRTCEKTLEVERRRLVLYPGDVEAYLAFKEEQREQEVRYNRNIEAKRRHLQEFADRYRARAATASRAQSKLKQLEKLQPIAIEHPIHSVRIRLPPMEAKKGVALRCADLAIGYPGKVVASGIRFEIERGEHVAVLGDNGEGKTTFLRTLAGQLAPLGGEYRWGFKLDCAYYSQHVYSALDPEQDIYSYLAQAAARDLVHQDILDMAGSFLFQGDEVRTPIAVLSGGERSRLALAGLLLSRKPVLLFDEPTNHLDFETVEALGTALKEHPGTILFVSHDRTFVRLVATSIAEVRQGRVVLYPSDYETYVYQAEQEIAAAERATEAPPAPGARKARRRSPDRDRARELRLQAGRLRRRIREVEERIASWEAERQAIHQHYLLDPLDPSPEKRLREEELGRLLERAEEEWLGLQEELEAGE